MSEFTKLKFAKYQNELNSFIANSHGNQTEQQKAIKLEKEMIKETERASLLLTENSKANWK